jgi:hypothetical protein
MDEGSANKEESREKSPVSKKWEPSGVTFAAKISS